MHRPVLLQQVIEALGVKQNGIYIDATVGEGGHTIEILKRGGSVLGIDVDLQQIENLKRNIEGGRLKLEVGNYADIERIAKEQGFSKVDGVVFDLGLSMRQLKSSGRGFSYKSLDDALDMRIGEKDGPTAGDLIKNLDEDGLYEIFARFSEELNSRAIAATIVRSRGLKRIEKVGDLIEVIDRVLGRRDEKVYSRIFQALRIAVNNEFENMKKGIEGAYGLLRKNGRIAVITFHSLEDRFIKRIIKEHEWLTEKVVTSRSGAPYERSAKLRVIIKNENYN